MNRRTLLRGATATAAGAAIAARRPEKSFAAGGNGVRRLTPSHAQLPFQYELIDLWRNDVFIEDNGQTWRGVVRGISNNGTMIGETVIDGILRATLWDADLAVSYPEMGQYEGLYSLGFDVNDQGLAVGELRPAGTSFVENAEFDFDRIPLVWQGTSQLDTSFLPIDSMATTLYDDGEVLGTVGNTAGRWTGSEAETIDLPAGYSYGGFRSRNSVGDTAGTFYTLQEPYSGGTPFVMSADGSVTMLERPGGRGSDWQGTARAFVIEDSGDLIVSVLDYGTGAEQILRYSGGTQIPLTDLNGEGAHLNGVSGTGLMVGQSNLNGVSIPTLWVDEQPMIIADMIVPGPDRILTEVTAVNDAGALVGDAVDSAGVSYSVLLRPV